MQHPIKMLKEEIVDLELGLKQRDSLITLLKEENKALILEVEKTKKELASK